MEGLTKSFKGCFLDVFWTAVRWMVFGWQD